MIAKNDQLAMVLAHHTKTKRKNDSVDTLIVVLISKLNEKQSKKPSTLSIIQAIST